MRPDLTLSGREGLLRLSTALGRWRASLPAPGRPRDYFKQTEDGRIHKLYNEWIRSLESTIRRELAGG